MTNETAKVKLPVRLVPDSLRIRDVDGCWIADASNLERGNELISILNSHTALIEAAREIANWPRPFTEETPSCMADLANEALKSFMQQAGR